MARFRGSPHGTATRRAGTSDRANPVGMDRLQGQLDLESCRRNSADGGGELVAVAYSHGREVGRSSLRSAHGPASLTATPEHTRLVANHRDLAFVTLELRDPEGTLITCDDRELTATETRSGALQGFGSARPVTEEGYRTGMHTTFEGRALAIIRPTGPGLIVLNIAGLGISDVTVNLRGFCRQLAFASSQKGSSPELPDWTSPPARAPPAPWPRQLRPSNSVKSAGPAFDKSVRDDAESVRQSKVLRG